MKFFQKNKFESQNFGEIWSLRHMQEFDVFTRTFLFTQDYTVVTFHQWNRKKKKTESFPRW